MQITLKLILRGLLGAVLFLPLGCSDDDNTPTGNEQPNIGTTWRLAREGSSASVEALAVHDTLAVAVGDGGAVRTSTDGREWIVRREYGPGAGYLDVTWGLGQFVAVGMNGDAIASTDGISWIRQSTGGTATLRGVASSDDITVAVGDNGTVYASDDNDLWIEQLSAGSLDLYDVCYASPGKLWLAAGSTGKILHHSPLSGSDTVNWVDQTTPMSPTMSFKALACTDSAAYFAIGVETSLATGDRAEVYRSTDGSVWFYQATLAAWDIEDLFWTGRYLVAVGQDDPTQVLGQDGLIFFSEDGATWTKAALGSPLDLTAVAELDSTIIAAGDNGYFLAGENPDSLGIVLSGSSLTGVVRAGDRYVAVTDRGTSLQSTDGLTWHENPDRIAYSLFRLASSGSSLVSLGGAGVLTELYTSTDGTSWTQTHSSDSTLSLFADICWGGDRFVAVGYFGAVLVSTDGESWSPQSTGDSASLQAVCWDGSRFVAGSFESGAYFSTDGVTWIHPAVAPAAVPVINRLTYGGGRYVAVGNSYGSGSVLEAYVSVSTDGESWNVINLGAFDTFYDIAWTGSHYVICGKEGQLYYSSNGTDWTDSGAPTTANLYDLATGGGKAIVVGSDGTVLVSP